jgi:acylphosphatase
MTASLPQGFKSASVLIKGRVQGVWFRAWTSECAQNLGLAGRVRNLPTGDVEAVFVGPSDAVDEIVLACRTGPPLARVDDIEFRDIAEDEAVELLGFEFNHQPTG